MSDSINDLGANGEFDEDGREIVIDTSGEADLNDSVQEDVEELRETLAQQDSEAEKYAIEFLKKVVRIRGVRITRDEFLRQELRKLHMGDEAIASAVDSNPVLAGVSFEELDKLAEDIISFETNKSAAMSFAAGLPGGFAMVGTIPVDLTQYYVHAFRIMQKLAYLYGWRELISDMDEVDDETIVFRRHAGGWWRSPVADNVRTHGGHAGASEADHEAGTDEDLLVPGYEALPALHRHQPHEEDLRAGGVEGDPADWRRRVGKYDLRVAPIPVLSP